MWALLQGQRYSYYLVSITKSMTYSSESTNAMSQPWHSRVELQWIKSFLVNWRYPQQIEINS